MAAAIMVLVFAYTIGPGADGNDVAGGVATGIIKIVPVVVIVGVIGPVLTLVGGRGQG